jgi:hypothetical protein
MNLLPLPSTTGRSVMASRAGTTTGWTLIVMAALVSSGCQPSASAPSDAGVKRTPASRPAGTSDETDGQVPVAATGSTHESSDSVAPGERVESPVSPGREAVNDTDAIEIVFEDIQLPVQADMVFRPFMLTDRVKELEGKRVRINGYMLPDSRTKGIRQFVLLKNTECKFGPGGQADHLVNVLMTDGVTAKYRDDPIAVEGVLTVNPFEGPDGNTWSIYDLACDHVETYRPRR